MNIRFLGAVEGVTGSCHLIEFRDKLIMLDCGMYQGKDKDFNYKGHEVSPENIDYLLLSHSHIDHSGRIPLLVKNGFKGTIYCSKPTYDLCEIMLLDSAHIQEAEAEWRNRKARRSGKPTVPPLYTQTNVYDSFKYFKPVLYEQIVKIDEFLTVRFNDAGHVLGSSIIEMWFEEDDGITKVVYSGDLGMRDKPLLKDPVIIGSADYVILESTYGNRIHANTEQPEEQLLNIILKTVRRGGTVIIPSFAVGRTQEIIYHLNKYYDNSLGSASDKINELKRIPVYIDSPLAKKATEVFWRNAHAFDKEARNYLMMGDNPLQFENLHFTENVEESKMLNHSDEPKIIISSSGMCDAGRIKHHLKHNLWKKECSVVFVGYQAEGTLGRRILDGAKDVKIFGEEIHVNAEIHNVEGFSAHADRNGLINWLKGFKEKPRKIFLVHGEAQSKAEFANEIKNILDIDCVIPAYNVIYKVKKRAEVVELSLKHRTWEEWAAVEENALMEELKNKLRNLKRVSETAFNLTEEWLREDDFNLDRYNRINNELAEIESRIMNLALLSGE
ncbi:MAG: MBL fold metallo-hydrolase RNA specificity domain-containing protein [Caldicoprobacteraceae bacterium]|jgi:metallo-beta-lactamase family protein